MNGKPTYEQLENTLCKISEEHLQLQNRVKSLEKADSFYRAFFEFGQDGVVILDPYTTAPIDFNDQVCQQLGYSRSEFARLRLSDIEAKETPEVSRNHIQSILNKGFDSFETLHRTKSGEIRHVHVSAKLIQVGSKQIYHCIWRDISQRIRAVEKFRIAFNNAPVGILLTDSQGVVVDCNPHFAQIFEVAKERYLGMNLLSLIPQGPVRQNLADAISDSKRHLYEGPYVSILSGKKLQVSISTEKAAENLYITIIIDITDRKRTEDALRESEDKFRLTFNSSPDSVNVNRLDDGLYVDINEGFTRITGYNRADVIGKTSLELNIWHDPADRQRMVRGIKDHGFVENLEAQFQKKDGTLLTGLMSARLLSLNGVPHVITITRDITERLKHQNEQLKIEKLESLGILAGGIAHDFNNVLTGIMGNISLAKAFLPPDHKAYKQISESERAAVRASELAHQLLTFARGGEPIKKVVSPRHLVDEAVSFILHGSNVKGVVEIPDSIHAIEVDEGQMSQVLHNIIINAIQAMPGGGILTITALNETLHDDNPYSLPAGQYIRLAFSDQGCGITNENLIKIFDPYFTTKSTGIGLGLSSVHSIVNRHGGHIGVISRLGVGTTFTIHLPSIGRIFTEGHRHGALQQSDRKREGVILVMDDEEIIRDIASSMLTHLGYNVAVCKDGQEAVQLYQAAAESGSPFLMAIMDLTIPGGTGGKQAAEQILSLFPKACLVVSSGYSNDPIMSDYRKYGFRGAIAKPFNLNGFQEVLSLLVTDK